MRPSNVSALAAILCAYLAGGCSHDKVHAVKCGDGTCDASENCQSCPADCGCPTGKACLQKKCIVPCGDGTCEPDLFETCATCPKDCGCSSSDECVNASCVAKCGDGTCSAEDGENCSTCPADCGCNASLQECVDGACRLRCGNSTCDSSFGEGCTTCPGDCPCSGVGAKCENNVCSNKCGDGTCESDLGENCSTCAQDCGCTNGATCNTTSGACESAACDAPCALTLAGPDRKVNTASGTAGPTVAVDGAGDDVVAYGFGAGLAVAADQGSGTFAPLAPATSAQVDFYGSHQLVRDGSALVALWDHEDTNSHVHSAFSSDGGAHWSSESQVDSVSGNAFHGSLAADGGFAYAAWSTSVPSFGVYFAKSSDHGATWSRAVLVNDDPWQEDQTSLAVQGNVVLVAWHSFAGDMYVSRSTDGGASFPPPLLVNDVRLKAIGEADQPFVALKGQQAYLVWEDGRTDSEGDIYMATSTDGGATFGPGERVNDVTLRYQEAPTVRISPTTGKAWVVWQDFRANDSTNRYDIWAAGTSDGHCFCKSARLNNDQPGDQMNPAFAIDAQGRLVTAWRDARTNQDFDIYENVATPSP